MSYEHPLYGQDDQTSYLDNYTFNYGDLINNLPAVDIDAIPQVGGSATATGSALQSQMVKKLAFGAVLLFVAYKVL